MQIPVRLTYKDLEELPDQEGKRYELCDGEVWVSAAPRIPHQQLAFNLQSILVDFVEHRGLGTILGAVDVYLREDTVLAPDLVFVRTGREDIIEEKWVNGVPDLVIEILSPTTQGRDRGAKMQAYARAGVPEYWMFDAAARRAEVYGLRSGAFVRIAEYGETGILKSEVLTGLEISLKKIWPKPLRKH